MNKMIGVAIAIIIVGGISTYAIAPYFTGSSIDEAIPTDAITQTTMDDKDTIKMADDTTKMMEDKTMMDDTKMDDTTDITSDDMAQGVDITKEDAMKDNSEMDMTMMDDTLEGMTKDDMMESATSYAGTFIGVNDGIHNAEGDAYTISLKDGSEFLRLENFKATNGPDLYVYLSTDDRASEYVSLGKLKANSGNQNYMIPEDTDLEKYDKVLIWCQAFTTLFGSAELSVK